MNMTTIMNKLIRKRVEKSKIIWQLVGLVLVLGWIVYYRFKRFERFEATPIEYIFNAMMVLGSMGILLAAWELFLAVKRGPIYAVTYWKDMDIVSESEGVVLNDKRCKRLTQDEADHLIQEVELQFGRPFSPTDRNMKKYIESKLFHNGGS